MSVKLIDRLKRVLGALPLPPETRAHLVGASTLREGVERLDELITTNEVEFRELQKELAELERVLAEEAEQAGSEQPGVRSARVARLRVEQLERHADVLEERLKIHDANLRLQVALLGRLQAIDAMELKGLDERQVDSVALDFEEELKRHLAVIEAGGPPSQGQQEVESSAASFRWPPRDPAAIRQPSSATKGGEEESPGGKRSGDGKATPGEPAFRHVEAED